MRAKPLITWMALGLSAMVLSSCYTVLKAPRTAADVQQEQIWKADRSTDPRIGRFDDRDEQDDFYRYPGNPYGGYGYGGSPYGYGGFPILTYDSRYGLYGAGGYGNPHYGAGYGPYGYGYDPYYQDDGLYIPPGYELVSTRELEGMHDTIRTLSAQQEESQPREDFSNDLMLNQYERDQEAIWENRTTPTRTRESSFTPRPQSSEPRKISTSSSSSKPASSSKSTEKKPDISSKKKRRR
jgi:hypothetical protein